MFVVKVNETPALFINYLMYLSHGSQLRVESRAYELSPSQIELSPDDDEVLCSGSNGYTMCLRTHDSMRSYIPYSEGHPR